VYVSRGRGVPLIAMTQPPQQPTPVQVALELHRAGKLREAEAVYRDVLARDPQDAGANYLLGAICLETGRLAEAVALLERAARLVPGAWDVQNQYSIALRESGRVEEAIAASRRAVAARPVAADAQANLGLALQQSADLAGAAAAYREAIRLDPKHREAHNNLGNVLSARREFVSAEQAYRTAIELDAKSPITYANLASVLQELERPDEAVEACRAALALEPGNAQAHNNLGNALRRCGEMDEAVRAFRRAIEIRPDYASAHSNYLFALHFLPSFDAAAIRDEHLKWAASQAEPLTAAAAALTVRDRSPDRRLRVGYVSPDFRQHAVAYFVLPIIAGHDRGRFEVVCYSDVPAADHMTEAIRARADRFVQAQTLDDAQLAARVRADEVDILIDLALHSGRNRMLTFARRAAPVQATYLGYPGTSGMRAMDYRLTDPHLDPPGADADADAKYVERSLRLPRTYWCYNPPPDLPPVAPLPAAANGFVTFGSLNNFTKVSDNAVRAWGEVLARVPESRLMLHAPIGGARQRVLAILAQHNVAAERVQFVDAQPALAYMKTYDRIDIALDPLPYNGGTTTCDALLMGAAVVSLAGDCAVRRAGASILTNAGLAELIATTPQRYVEIAAELAGDVERLAVLRAGMRPRMLASPLTDSGRFVRDLEAAYRQMWREKVSSSAS
jgi:predicted O-linked N-acetylglucosamine transferase (SPINDLY family)